MGYSHVAHDVIIGNNCIFANVATLAGHVEIADNVVIGGLTPIHQFCKNWFKCDGSRWLSCNSRYSSFLFSRRKPSSSTRLKI